MALLVPGDFTNQEETITVSTSSVGPTADTFGTCNRNGVIVMVLSQSINFTLHSADAEPDGNDFVANAGDAFIVKPANRLRMKRVGGTDACVKLNGFTA